jgi:hypothetical protein
MLFRPDGACSYPLLPTYGWRRALHSFAASRLSLASSPFSARMERFELAELRSAKSGGGCLHINIGSLSDRYSFIYEALVGFVHASEFE